MDGLKAEIGRLARALTDNTNRVEAEVERLSLALTDNINMVMAEVDRLSLTVLANNKSKRMFELKELRHRGR